MEKLNVAVYCGASLGKRPEYAKHAAVGSHSVAERLPVHQESDNATFLPSYTLKRLILAGYVGHWIGINLIQRIFSSPDLPRLRTKESVEGLELGKYLTSCKIGVVFGGSDYGLLGVMGNAAGEDGGMVTGILPEFFTKMKDYKAVGKEIIVPDMHTRKKMMFDKVNAFIALPGGVGTMEELTEILTWAKLDIHSRPVALLNTAGYYDHFIKWLERAIDDGFIPAQNIEELLLVETDPIQLVDKLRDKFNIKSSC